MASCKSVQIINCAKLDTDLSLQTFYFALGRLVSRYRTQIVSIPLARSIWREAILVLFKRAMGPRLVQPSRQWAWWRRPIGCPTWSTVPPTEEPASEQFANNWPTNFSSPLNSDLSRLSASAIPMPNSNLERSKLAPAAIPATQSGRPHLCSPHRMANT